MLPIESYGQVDPMIVNNSTPPDSVDASQNDIKDTSPPEEKEVIF